MKAVYRADTLTHTFVSSDIVPDDYVLKANETFENPTGKLEPPKLAGTTWLDATQEEHQAYLNELQAEYAQRHPEFNQPTEPDKSDQALNLLGQQIAKMQAMQEKMQGTQVTMAQSINALGQLVAKAQVPAVQQPTEPAQPGSQATTPQA